MTNLIKAEEVKRGMVLKDKDGLPLIVRTVKLTRTSAVIETKRMVLSVAREEMLRRL